VKPVCYDIFCGLGGWTEAFLAEGYRCIGFDIEAHRYPRRVSVQQDSVKRPGMNWSDRSKKGPKDAQFNRPAELDPSGEWEEYPGKLILRDVRSIHGSELKDAAIIVASPPCQAYSYRAMPWKRAKALPPPDNTLFNECFRIQREAIAASGHHIPLIVENVRGAQKWVGRARWNYGSFYLWGDVPALMPFAKYGTLMKYGKLCLSPEEWKRTQEGELIAHPNSGIKQSGISGIRENGKGDKWFQDGAAKHGSNSNARKAASAMIAKIPFALASHIARVYKPREEQTA
jgi:hypothetical protein